MRLRKLPVKKKVTVKDLLETADRNEMSHAVRLVVDCINEESPKIAKILVVTEYKDGMLVIHRAGFTNTEIVYLNEMMKHKAIKEDLFEKECGEDECDCEDD